jgi:predicted N-acetyltransferase YhbS
LVAEDSSGVIAHVMLSLVGVAGGSRTRILNLTPMSVRPDRQRIGVGARLIRDALGCAEEAGELAQRSQQHRAYTSALTTRPTSPRQPSSERQQPG